MIIINDQAFILVPVRMTKEMKHAAFQARFKTWDKWWVDVLRARPRVEQQVRIEKQQQQG
jgi:hypothetical protein